jgi:integrase
VKVIAKYPYLCSDVDRHGNVRVYFRRAGQPKVRLREKLDSEAFRRRYDELLAGGPKAADQPQTSLATPKRNTLRWLCVEFFGSPDFKRLDPRTQYTRRRILELMFDEPIAPGAKETFGEFPLDRLRPKDLRVLRDRKADLPGAADNRVRALRRVFKWGLKNEHVKSNPARDVEYVAKGSEGWHSWTPAELIKFEERHPVGTKPRLALALLMYTGARRSDVVRLGKGNVQDGWIKFSQRKTSVPVELPMLPALQEIIDVTPVVGATTYLVTQYGKPFTAAGFGNWFRDRCNEAVLPQCSAHGVRKASAARAAENGATVHQLMSMFGWLTMHEAQRYTKAAERKRLARDAAVLLKR